jgi:hypothetical protein
MHACTHARPESQSCLSRVCCVHSVFGRPNGSWRHEDLAAPGSGNAVPDLAGNQILRTCRSSMLTIRAQRAAYFFVRKFLSVELGEYLLVGLVTRPWPAQCPACPICVKTRRRVKDKEQRQRTRRRRTDQRYDSLSRLACSEQCDGMRLEDYGEGATRKWPRRCQWRGNMQLIDGEQRVPG